MLSKNQQLLSDLTVHEKYARWIESKNRKENWTEIVDRNKAMHLERYPELFETINYAYQFVYDKKILPSMRSLQFAGAAIKADENRIYNCAYLEMNKVEAFGELMFNLLCGTGQGYSVQFKDVDQLPFINKSKIREDYIIKDNKEGWADSIKQIMLWAFGLANKPIFEYTFIRRKGTVLKTSGGKAPGREPLVKAHNKIFALLNDVQNGSKLTPFQVHLINCICADAVVSGGIRRAALISLFSVGDDEMFECKTAENFNKYPELGRANNSVMLDLETTTYREFDPLLERIFKIGTGEPGIVWTNNFNVGTNPCGEISLYPDQFCNLVEINGSNIKDENDFYERCEAASIIATLQAGYTNFNYLNPNWKKQTEEEALIGVGITGICSNSINTNWLRPGALIVNSTNEDIANQIGINPAARTTTIKPSGTSSLVLGTSSGIHAYYSKYYIRRLTVFKDEAIYKYFMDLMPELVEDSTYEGKDNEAYIMIPVEVEGNVTTVEDETALDMLERVKVYNEQWVRPGHVRGDMPNNVSCSVYYKKDEKNKIKSWMWANGAGNNMKKEERIISKYRAIALFPYDNNVYKHSPLEKITKEQYDEMSKFVRDIDLDDIAYYDDTTNFIGDAVACAGGACEIR